MSIESPIPFAFLFDFFFLLIFVANFVQLRPPMDLFGDFNFYSGDLVENFKKKNKHIYIYIHIKKTKKNDKKPKMLKHIQNKKNIRKRNKKKTIGGKQKMGKTSVCYFLLTI